MTTTILALIVLCLVLIAMVAAIWSAHIPGLRHWTGAAPLSDDDDWPDAGMTTEPDDQPGHVCRQWHPTGAGDTAYQRVQAERHRINGHGDPQ